MKKYLANMVTSVRILGSIWLLFAGVFSPGFYTAYLVCGFTDMVDGTIARKTKSETAFGSALDSVADFVFVMVSAFKICPELVIHGWLWAMVTMILAIRIGNLILGFSLRRRFTMEHTALNKVTGLLLFLLPLTLSFMELRYSANVVCVVAAVSAIQEGAYIWRLKHASGITGPF